MSQQLNRNLLNLRKQKGAITMFSAILILILLTELVIYAVQVGVFEQRKSANELRQKIAFHTADSGIQHAKEFLRQQAILVASAESELVPIVDGKGDITGYKPGWLAPGAGIWTECAGNYSEDDKTHPCWAEPVSDLRDNSYFYNVGGSDLLLANPVAGSGVNENVTLHALLCMLEVDRDADPVVQGCTTNTGLHDSRYFMVTLLARGQADCDDNGLNCTAEALIAEKIGSFGPGGGDGGPGAPLTTKSTLPESGDTDIVTNPNGGGVGVPVSVWIDGVNADIEGFGGSWTTCEAHEWYETDILPEDRKCPAGSGNCTCDGKKQLSHSAPGAGEQFLNIDMVPDQNFPPDLFFHLFRHEGNEAGVEYVKSIADDVVDDCSGFGPGTYGLIVVTGRCSFTGNVTVGSAKAPVFLVLTGAGNAFGGTVDIFGTIFVTDAVNAATIDGKGTITMYGALIADGDISKFGGNLKLVYVQDIIDRSFETGKFGTVAGGWTDFHAEWR